MSDGNQWDMNFCSLICPVLLLFVCSFIDLVGGFFFFDFFSCCWLFFSRFLGRGEMTLSLGIGRPFLSFVSMAISGLAGQFSANFQPILRQFSRTFSCNASMDFVQFFWSSFDLFLPFFGRFKSISPIFPTNFCQFSHFLKWIRSIFGVHF